VGGIALDDFSAERRMDMTGEHLHASTDLMIQSAVHCDAAFSDH
jgi:hypothetical protein